jgi:hypothetical protein
MGVAYNEKKKYRTAEKYFLRALKRDSKDAFSMKYLYYCYIYNRQFNQAQKLSAKFPKDLAAQMKTDSLPAINYAFGEFAVKIPSDQSLFGLAYNKQVGFEHRVGRSISVLHSFSNYYQVDKDSTRNQWEYYLRLNYSFAHLWNLKLSFHPLTTGFKTLPVVGPRRPPREPVQSTYSWNPSYAAGISIEKSLPLLDLKYGLGFSDMLGVKQIQHVATIKLFPFKNNWLTLSQTVYVQTLSDFSQPSYASQTILAFSLWKKWMFSAEFLHSNILNLNEGDVYLVNNSPDVTTGRISFSGLFSVSRHFDLYATYALEQKTRSTQNTPYHYQIINAGIIYKP